MEWLYLLQELQVLVEGLQLPDEVEPDLAKAAEFCVGDPMQGPVTYPLLLELVQHEGGELKEGDLVRESNLGPQAEDVQHPLHGRRWERDGLNKPETVERCKIFFSAQSSKMLQQF